MPGFDFAESTEVCNIQPLAIVIFPQVNPGFQLRVSAAILMNRSSWSEEASEALTVTRSAVLR